MKPARRRQLSYGYDSPSDGVLAVMGYAVRMAHLTIIATIRARAGHEDEVLDGLRGLIAPTRSEDGCARYDLHRDLEDPTRFVFYETWESQEHLARHLESAHIVANRERVGSSIEDIALQRLEQVE